MLILPRTLWIAEEKELVHEIAGLGELRQPWLVDKTFFLAFDMFHSSSPIILHFSFFHFPFSISVCHHFPSSGLGELRQPWSVLFYLYPVESTSTFFSFIFTNIHFVWQALESNEVVREPSQLDKHLLCGPRKPRQLQRYDKDDDDYEDWLEWPCWWKKGWRWCWRFGAYDINSSFS